MNGGTWAIALKIAGLAVLNAVGVYAVLALLANEAWPVALMVGVGTLLLDWIYFSRRAVPAKYLAPGVVVLVVFQLFTLAFTVYIAFTNFGDGHLGTKDDAISALVSGGRERVPDSPAYAITVLEQDGELSFLVTDPRLVVSVGNARAPLSTVADAVLDEGGKGVGLEGYEALTFPQILARQAEILALEVPISADPEAGALRTTDGRTAYVYRSVLIYDAAADAMVDTRTGVVYPDNGRGSFESAEGQELLPGWRAVVGLDNFVDIASQVGSSTQLVGVFGWNVSFAFLNVLMAFSLGMFLALVFNDPRVRGRRLYRILLILPYAFPAFLSITIWSGMLNTQFGFINEVLLGGADIPWLRDPWLARLSVLTVGLWLDFPWFFLVATGALQSIPAEVEEAATLDGASRWQLFRGVRLPLLLVSLAPLLISAFAFAFNNFNLVWLLNQGGPTSLGDAQFNLGATDLLISVVYRIGFIKAIHEYGLASAFAVIIFLIVGLIAIWSFRRTRRLEEVF